MANLNKVFIIGNLTRDPELRYTQSGLAVCDVRMAVNRKFAGQNGEQREETCFIDVTVFGKRGEAFSKFFQKGKQAFFEGRLKFDQWDDKQTGQKRSKLSVVAEDWQFVGPATQGSGGGGRYAPAGGDEPAMEQSAGGEEPLSEETPF